MQFCTTHGGFRCTHAMLACLWVSMELIHFRIHCFSPHRKVNHKWTFTYMHACKSTLRRLLCACTTFHVTSHAPLPCYVTCTTSMFRHMHHFHVTSHAPLPCYVTCTTSMLCHMHYFHVTSHAPLPCYITCTTSMLRHFKSSHKSKLEILRRNLTYQDYM